MADFLPILYTDTVLNGNTGLEYTLEVQPDWMAGRGLFTDENDEPNRFRWTVYRESEYRPQMAYRYGIGSLERAIEQGTAKLRSYR